MKTLRPVVLLVALGSIWGFLEILHLPNGLVGALAVLLLVMGRRMLNVPGTSAAMGLIVCFYKTYSTHFFICQWAGIMSVAISFELFASLVLRDQPWKLYQSALIGAGTALLALPAFIIWVVYVIQEPNWVAGGWDRIVSYAMRNTGTGVLVSAISAPLGTLAGNAIVTHLIERKPAVSLGVYSTLVVVLWVAATAFKIM